MIYRKNTHLHGTMNISQARVVKRSESTRVLQFQPMKLKKLQEARNEAKSATNKKLSLQLLDFEKTIFGLLGVEKDGLEKIEEVSRTENEGGKDLGMKELERNEEKEENEGKRVVSGKQSVKGSPSRRLSGNYESRIECRNGNLKMKGKPIQSVLDIIGDDKNVRKRLTKDQEKGLINRLQGKSLFKFS